MKKNLLIAALFALTLVACGKQEEATAPAVVEETTTAAETTTTAGETTTTAAEATTTAAETTTTVAQ